MCEGEGEEGRCLRVRDKGAIAGHTPSTMAVLSIIPVHWHILQLSGWGLMG